jgi:hypothetical protein
LPHLERAARNATGKVYAHYVLGRAYLKLGRKSEAAQQFALVKTMRQTQ